MARRSDTSLAVLALVMRSVPSEQAPLRARELRALLDAVGDPARLLGADETTLDDLVGPALSPRVAALLDRASAVAFELERLEQAGIATLSQFDEGYPPRLAERLGASAPPFLHVAGPAALLSTPALGVVGSRDVSPEGADVARQAGAAAAGAGLTVVSGGARGTDRLALDAALGAGGPVDALLAEALVRVADDPAVRRSIGEEALCLATPYAPAAPFSVGNAMGRNKLIYALARVTLVVASDEGQGGTWAGATEALKQGYGTVAVWTGPGGGPGNAALVERGGEPVTTVDALLDLASADPSPPAPERAVEGSVADEAGEQLGLGI